MEYGYDDFSRGQFPGEMGPAALKDLETAVKALREGNRKLALYYIFQAIHLLAVDETDEVARYALEMASNLIRDAMYRTR